MMLDCFYRRYDNCDDIEDESSCSLYIARLLCSTTLAFFRGQGYL